MEDRQLLNTYAPVATSQPPQAPSGRATGPSLDPAELQKLILAVLDDAKAEDVLTIDLASKSTLADTMVIASGRSQRHVGSTAQKVVEELEKAGLRNIRLEGMPACDWVLIDAGDAIVHLFRPEVREFYKLERLWVGDRPNETPRNM